MSDLCWCGHSEDVHGIEDELWENIDRPLIPACEECECVRFVRQS